MGKTDISMKDGKAKMTVDLNEDGQPLMELELHLGEALQEVIARGSDVDGAKLVGFSLSGKHIKLSIDTDKDGEKVLDLKIDITELLDEVGVF